MTSASNAVGTTASSMCTFGVDPRTSGLPKSRGAAVRGKFCLHECPSTSPRRRRLWPLRPPMHPLNTHVHIPLLCRGSGADQPHAHLLHHPRLHLLTYLVHVSCPALSRTVNSSLVSACRCPRCPRGPHVKPRAGLLSRRRLRLSQGQRGPRGAGSECFEKVANDGCLKSLC